jgi:glutaredoxin
MKHIEGKNKQVKVFAYTLSTCIWCKKTKKLLQELDIDFDYEDVDLLEDGEKDKAVEAMEKWVKSASFPLLIFDNKKHISGFDEDAIKKALKSDE